MAERILYRTFTPAQVRASSGLAGAARRIATTFEGDTWTIRFIPQPKQLADARAVPLQLAGLPAGLDFSPTPGGNWHRRFESAPPLETIPEPFRGALHAALCEEILNAIESATGLTARLGEENGQNGSDTPVRVAWEALNSHGQKEAEGALTVDERVVGDLLESARTWPSEPDTTWLNSLELTAPVVLDAFPISPAAFAQAAPGDIWLLTVSSDADPAKGSVRFPGTTMTCLVSGIRDLPLPQSPDRFDSSPSLAEPDAMNTPDAKHWTDDLNVELAFQIGTLTLKLEQLRSLEEGHVFELSAPVNEPVTLLVNGKPSGRGELVRIGDRLGVLLTAKTAAE